MIDHIYVQSMASKGNQYCLRLVIVSLFGMSLLIVAFLNLSISEVITTDGQVYPEHVVRIYAPNDLWIKFERDRAGTHVQEGEQVGVMRYHLNTDIPQRHIELKNEQLVLLKQLKIDHDALIHTTQTDLRSTAIDQEIDRLGKEIDTLEQELQSTPFVATMSGELRLMDNNTSDFIFVRKGNLLAEIFSPDALIIRTSLSPDQAQRLQEATAVFVEDDRTATSVPARIDHMYYADLGTEDEAIIIADIHVDQLTHLSVGQGLHIRIVAGERSLFEVLRDVFAR